MSTDDRFDPLTPLNHFIYHLDGTIRSVLESVLILLIKVIFQYNENVIIIEN